MTTYKDAAGFVYQRALELIGPTNSVFVGPPNGFWHQADTLDACIQHLVLTNQSDSQNLVANAIKYVFNTRMENKPPSEWAQWSLTGDGPWADDYGWWGIALLRAYQNRSVLGYDDGFAEGILKLAEDCFHGLAGCWDNSEAVPGSGIKGGAWNHNDTSQALTGRNCVTNEVLWLLSQRLYGATKNSEYLEQNNLVENFFFAAADKKLNLLYTDKGLVLERLKGMVNQEYFPENQTLWYWIGDQGLFMGACLGNELIGGNKHADAARAVALRVVQNMTDTSLVLHDTLPPNTDFNDDYATGKGAFMRNWVLWNDPAFPKPADKFRELVAANATSAWNNRPWASDTSNSSKKYQFGFNWNPAAGGEPTFPGRTNNPSNFTCLVLQTAGLSAMNAVLELKGKEANEHIEVKKPATAG